MEVFDNELHDYLEEHENECRECGTPCNRSYCSDDCFNASML